MENSFAEGYAVGVDRNNGNNNGWNNASDWIWILILLALFGGWGNNGNGGGFGFNNGGCNNMNYEIGRLATTNDVASGFNNSAVLSNLNDLKLGQAQGFASVQQTLCQGFSGVNATVNQGFAGVNNAICTLGYQQAQLVNGLSRELADCCCTTQRNIDSLRFDLSKGLCDVIRAGQDNTNAIINYLTNEKIEGLRAENVALKGQISNDRQSQYIVSQLREPCPVPSYIVPNPNCCYQYNVQGYGYNNGGCGCGCNGGF